MGMTVTHTLPKDENLILPIGVAAQVGRKFSHGGVSYCKRPASRAEIDTQPTADMRMWWLSACASRWQVQALRAIGSQVIPLVPPKLTPESLHEWCKSVASRCSLVRHSVDEPGCVLSPFLTIGGHTLFVISSFFWSHFCR